MSGLQRDMLSYLPDSTTAVRGLIKLASKAEALAGLDEAKAVVSAGLSLPRSFNQSGYHKLPGSPGLVVQWALSGNLGDLSNGWLTYSAAFPIAFSGAVLAVVPYVAVYNVAVSAVAANWDWANTTNSAVVIKYHEYSSVVQTNVYIGYFAMGY